MDQKGESQPVTRNVPLQVTAVLVAVLAVMIYFRHNPGLWSLASAERTQLHAGAQALKMRTAYLENCASCHGAHGQGGSAKVDFSTPQAVASMSRKEMLRALDDRHDGRLSAPLKAADAARYVDFVRDYLMLPAPYEDASSGRRIYSESCSVCHGERGDGASWAQYSLYPPPRNFTAADPDALTRADMIAAVTFGKPSTAMMPFATQLKPDEIAATVDYIRVAFMTGEGSTAPSSGKSLHAAPSTSIDPGISSQNAAQGDPAVGRALYLANCIECHGQNGDGEGSRAYFMAVKPADFTSEAFRMRMDRERLRLAIAKGVVGSPMPAWDAVLPDDKIADLAAYVYRAFVAPVGADSESGASLHTTVDSKKKN